MTQGGNWCRAAVVAVTAVAHVGCASLTGAPSGVRGPPPEVGPVTLVVSVPATALEVTGMPAGKGAGARAQAWDFFVACQPAGGGGGGGGAAIFVFLIWEAVCVTGSGVAAIVGASRAPGRAEIRSMKAAAEESVAEIGIAQELWTHVVQAANRIAPGRLVSATPGEAPAEGTEAAGPELRVELSNLALRNVPDSRKLLYLVIRLDVAVVDAASGETLKATKIKYYSEARRLEEWVANDGFYLDEAIERAYPRLGEGVADFAFLLFPFPHQGVAHGWTYFTGLQAESPPHRAKPFSFKAFPRVESLQPTLSWQSFPREVDVAADPETMQRVTNVRYDLMISEPLVGTAGEVIYRQTALPENSHTIDAYLWPGRAYFWTVRARFELDGREYVTEWAQRGEPGILAPSGGNYVFVTP
jgi:hypothetical protein